MAKSDVRGSVVCLFVVNLWVAGLMPAIAGGSDDKATPQGTTNFGIPCPGFAGSTWTCLDVSPNYASFNHSIGQSVSGKILSLAVAGDGKRLYAAAFSGVWRSDDGGGTWQQLAQPQRPTFSDREFDGTMPSNVYSLAVPRYFPDEVLAATADDHRLQGESLNGIYRSIDRGETWTRVHRFDCDGIEGTAAGQIVFASDGDVVYAAGGCTLAWSPNRGETWYDLPLPKGGVAWHVAVGNVEGPATPPPATHFIRRIYAAGPQQLWYSEDGGVTWNRDYGVDNIRNPLGYGGQQAPFGQYMSHSGADGEIADGASMIVVEPGHSERLYLVAIGFTANGPSFFHPKHLGDDGVSQCTGWTVSSPKVERPCGGASLWIGDYSKFVPGRGAQWTQLHGPPGYFWGGTGSGTTYIAAKETANGYLLFLSDRDDVHVSNGAPRSAASWHRLGGRDISQSWCADCAGNEESDEKHCNQFQIHVDPHAIAVSPDFDIALAPAHECKISFLSFPVPYPYDQNSVLESYRQGTIWIANDGGIYRSMNGGQSWELGKNLSTLQPQGPFALLTLPGKPPALYFGVPDNDNFFSRDGAAAWKEAYQDCGDCGAWFSDPFDPTRVLESGRPNLDDPNRKTQSWSVYVSSSKGSYPDASSKKHAYLDIPLPSGTILTDDAARRGYKPVVVGIAGEKLPAGGDYIFLRDTPSGFRVLLRTQSLMKVKKIADWDSAASQQGDYFPREMAGATVVQASGGHRATSFYIGDPDRNKMLWRATKSGGWERIVPSADGSAKMARRFFVNPYDPQLIYIVDESAVKYSSDGGKTWNVEYALDNLVTEYHSITYEYRDDDIGYGVIRDMAFSRDDPSMRVAVGDAGVFVMDTIGWYRVFSTRAMPGHPTAVSFSPVAGSRDLYVAINGRGIVHLTRQP